MFRPSAEPVIHPHAEDGIPASAHPLAEAVRTAFDGIGFALLCLLTTTAPADLRRQLGGGWDAGFAPQHA